MCKKNIFIGFIKVGYKHLFIYNEFGEPVEINPLCVLDFYTFENCQRKGYGKIIFEEMIEKENITPRKLGYDRPSIKFINFLKKYYNLCNYIPQNNNYIVFNDYFTDVPKKKDRYDIYNTQTKRNYNNSINTKDINRSNLNNTTRPNERYPNNINNNYGIATERIKLSNNINNNSTNNSNNFSETFSNTKASNNHKGSILNSRTRKLGVFNRQNESKKDSKKDDNNMNKSNEEYDSKTEGKKYGGYKGNNPYQYKSSSSEYGAFFHYGK